MGFRIGGGMASISSNVTLVNPNGPLDYGFGVAGNTTLRTASVLGNRNGEIDYGAGTSSPQTVRTILASDQTPLDVNVLSGFPGGLATEETLGYVLNGIVDIFNMVATEATLLDVKGELGIATSQLGNIEGATVTTALQTAESKNVQAGAVSVVGLANILEAAPADARGFFLSACNTNDGNIFWSLTGAATIDSNPLEASRDTGFIPVASDLNLIADAAGQKFNLTWIRR